MELMDNMFKHCTAFYIQLSTIASNRNFKRIWFISIPLQHFLLMSVKVGKQKKPHYDNNIKHLHYMKT